MLNRKVPVTEFLENRRTWNNHQSPPENPQEKRGGHFWASPFVGASSAGFPTKEEKKDEDRQKIEKTIENMERKRAQFPRKGSPSYALNNANTDCKRGNYHSPRNFYKLIPLPIFFLLLFCYFYGNSSRHRLFFCNSHALFGESRGYCTKTKQEWPDSGSTLENIFCIFYEINSSQDFFCIANILVLMALRTSLGKIHCVMYSCNVISILIDSKKLLQSDCNVTVIF